MPSRRTENTYLMANSTSPLIPPQTSHLSGLCMFIEPLCCSCFEQKEITGLAPHFFPLDQFLVYPTEASPTICTAAEYIDNLWLKVLSVFKLPFIGSLNTSEGPGNMTRGCKRKSKCSRFGRDLLHCLEYLTVGKPGIWCFCAWSLAERSTSTHGN